MDAHGIMVNSLVNVLSNERKWIFHPELDYDKMGRSREPSVEYRDAELRFRIRLQLGGTVDE